MTDQSTVASVEPKTELTLVRVFDAPRELLWRTWTEPKLLAEWWGPRGFTNPVCEFEPRVNGIVNIVMLAGPELGEMAGSRFPMTGVVKEVEPTSRLVFSAVGMKDAQGKPMFTNLTTVTFEDDSDYAGKTKVTMHAHVEIEQSGPAVTQALGGMEQGWTESLDKLAELIATMS